MTTTATSNNITVTTEITEKFAVAVAGKRVNKRAIAPRYVVVYPGMDRWISVAGENDSRARYKAEQIARVREGARIIKVEE